MRSVLDLLEDEDEGRAYPLALQQLWLERLHQMSSQVAEACDSVGSDFGMRMRYQGNALKVWYAPNAHIEAGLDKPLAEQPIVKDKWIHQEVIPHPDIEEGFLIETTVLSYPPLEDRFVSNSAKILFGPSAKLQERYPDPEVQGGKIALIASNNNEVQKPPNSLDRMHASLPRASRVQPTRTFCRRRNCWHQLWRCGIPFATVYQPSRTSHCLCQLRSRYEET
jgi:hypothetical protein